MTPQIEPDLREFDLGDWEGRSFRDLREQEDLWGHWERDPGFAPPNGESPRQFWSPRRANAHAFGGPPSGADRVGRDAWRLHR